MICPFFGLGHQVWVILQTWGRPILLRSERRTQWYFRIASYISYIVTTYIQVHFEPIPWVPLEFSMVSPSSRHHLDGSRERLRRLHRRRVQGPSSRSSWSEEWRFGISLRKQSLNKKNDSIIKNRHWLLDGFRILIGDGFHFSWDSLFLRIMLSSKTVMKQHENHHQWWYVTMENGCEKPSTMVKLCHGTWWLNHQRWWFNNYNLSLKINGDLTLNTGI
jgi:hypothetical protein